jgi:hypothetical protein
MMYFVINNSGGDTTVTQYTHAELLDELNGGDWGSCYTFLDSIPTQNDTNYWGEGTVLIIKGAIVTPEEEKSITEYKLR